MSVHAWKCCFAIQKYTAPTIRIHINMFSQGELLGTFELMTFEVSLWCNFERHIFVPYFDTIYAGPFRCDFTIWFLADTALNEIWCNWITLYLYTNALQSFDFRTQCLRWFVPQALGVDLGVVHNKGEHRPYTPDLYTDTHSYDPTLVYYGRVVS